MALLIFLLLLLFITNKADIIETHDLKQCQEIFLV